MRSSLVKIDKVNHHFRDLYYKAHLAGVEAGNRCNPKAMYVADVIHKGRNYVCFDGVCGFAWVRIKGNTPFGRWCKSEAIARKLYTGGLQIRVTQYGQSMERKLAYATAFASVLANNNVWAIAESRLD